MRNLKILKKKYKSKIFLSNKKNKMLNDKETLIKIINVLSLFILVGNGFEDFG